METATDEFLRLSPPLPAVIKINRQHNHIPVKNCKTPKEICDMYYGYFNQGIKGIKAKRLHEKNLQRRKMKTTDGCPTNPRMTTVYTLYQKWKKLKKNAQINNKVPTCDSGPHASSRIDSAFISQEIKIEEEYEEEEYDSPSNMPNEVPVKIEGIDEENDKCLDFDEIVYQQQERKVKMEHLNKDDMNCPNFDQIVIHQQQVMFEIEEIVEEDNNCPNTGSCFSNSRENQLRDKRSNYNSRIQKKASNSKVSQKFSKNKNKLKSPKIVNCCSLNTGSQTNTMPSTSLVTDSNSYYISSTLVQTNNFVNIINPPPVPLIMNMTTNVNTNVVCPVQRAVSINNSHLTLYNPLSNTYTVVQHCLPTSPTVGPSNLYSAHFPNGILSPTRVGVNKF